MANRIEFRVCRIQDVRPFVIGQAVSGAFVSCVTHVNGKWQGKMPMTSQNVMEAFQSCPEECDYLSAAAAEGWEFLAVANEEDIRVIYLRRQVA